MIASRNRKLPCLLIATFVGWLLGTAAPLHAELRLASLLSDHLVLQREQPVPIWGWTEKQQPVTVRFAEQTVSTKSDDMGAWSVVLPAMPAHSAGRELVVTSGGQTVSVQDVVVGDVWHASGQSNMAMTVAAMAKELPAVKEHLAQADDAGIRFRRVGDAAAAEPAADLQSKSDWTVCRPATVAQFSGVAYYFALVLRAELDVPIGVIDSSRGGTPIEPYIPRAAFDSHPTLRRERELGDAGDLGAIWRLSGGVYARDDNWLPARLFNSRIAPLSRFPVRGVIWYQGESNCGTREDPRDYQHKMRALIAGWRSALPSETLPFYFVQLPGSGAGPGWPYLREQQRLAADLPHSGMAVTIDLEGAGIHPANKIDVAARLARLALADAYGKQLVSSGPMFASAQFGSGRAIVRFTHADEGLMIGSKQGLNAVQETPRARLAHFELADQAGNWQGAEATIVGTTVVVESPSIKLPIAVRYAYRETPEGCNFYNRAGLPASPFCSDVSLLGYDPGLPND